MVSGLWCNNKTRKDRGKSVCSSEKAGVVYNLAQAGELARIVLDRFCSRGWCLLGRAQPRSGGCDVIVAISDVIVAGVVTL